MELVGYIALIVMGITLGLVGAGGSILTIPILLYLFNIPIFLATSYSVIVVGTTAFVGVIRYRTYICFRKAIFLLIPSAIGVFTARHVFLPALPKTIGFLSIHQILVLLLLVLMFISSFFLIKNLKFSLKTNHNKSQNIKIIIMSTVLGIVMGLLGTGGGFLIVPALVLLLDIRINNAIPTSLLIIAFNSLVAFASDQYEFILKDWHNLAKYLASALFGMTIGLYIAKFANGTALKKLFGYFILFIGIAIFTKEFIL